jgi:glycerol uptake operon antiterminator
MGILLLFVFTEENMTKKLLSRLEDCPIIAAVRDRDCRNISDIPTDVIFDLGANVLTVGKMINEAHAANKTVFVHVDLAEGIGKDRYGVEYLRSLGADGIISTKTALLRHAKELSMITVKRVFLLDSQGVETAMSEMGDGCVDLVEIMPGVMPKMVKRFSELGVSVIAGGLIETKAEITAALSNGAVAISTGKKELWCL